MVVKADGTEAFADTYRRAAGQRGLGSSARCAVSAGVTGDADGRTCRTAAAPGLSAATAVVGVIGDPVDHSLSPRLHNAAFAAMDLDWVSVGFPVAAGRTAEAAARGGGPRAPRAVGDHAPQGMAATAGRSARLGSGTRSDAVNCVVFDDGVAVGENTDGAGLVAALRRGRSLRTRRDDAAWWSGAGGAGRAAVAGLADAGAAEVVVVNRSRPNGPRPRPRWPGRPDGWDRPRTPPSCDLVVNATPSA